MIGGLSNNTTYFVILTADGHMIQLAANYCRAVGINKNGNGCQTPGPGPLGGNDTLGGSVIPLTLTPIKNDSDYTSVTHTLTRASDFAIPQLTDGAGYYVVGVGGGQFQVSGSFGGSPILVTDGGGDNHIFRREGRDLTSVGSGEQRLILQLTATSGTQQLKGIGGPTGATSSIDGSVSASAAGGGGGAINVSTAKAVASTAVTVSNAIGSGATISGANVNVTTNGYALSKAIAGNAGGGAISIGDSAGQDAVYVSNQITITGATITATNNLTVTAYSDLRPSVFSSTDQGGFIGGSFGETTAYADYDTGTTTSGTLTAGNIAKVEAMTYVNAYAKSVADVGGFGADAETKAQALVGYGVPIDVCASCAASAKTLLDVTGGTITGRHVKLNAIMPNVIVQGLADTSAGALGANSDAEGNALLSNVITRLTLSGNVVGQVDTALTAENDNIDLYAHSFANCDCLGGDTDADSTVTPDMIAKVIGNAGSVITTSDLTVSVNNQIKSLNPNADTSEGFLDFGNGGDTHGNYNTIKREIFWQVRVIMLGEPNPWLEVDASGNITKIVNLKLCSNAAMTIGCYEDNPFTDTHTQGLLSGPTFYVDDIVYDHGARARFLANDMSGVCGPSGGCAPGGDIWGRGGVFEFQQTWDFVKLLNASAYNMVTNIIDVVNTDNPPRIDIRVDNIPPGTGTNSPGLSSASPGASFDFDIKYKFPPSWVQIRNTCAFSCPPQPFIRLDDYVENPIGKTEITNASGDILSGPGKEIIRTNTLIISAPHGNVGQQSPTHAEPDTTRNPIAIELVRFKHPDPAFCPQGGSGGLAPCLYDFSLQVDAGGDVVMDLTANRRTDEALGSPLTVVIDHINAGNDIDVVVNDSKNGNDQTPLTLVVVDLYDPATGYYHYVYYNTYNPGLGADSGPQNTAGCSGPYPGNCGNGSGSYETHFRPDASDPNLALILMALGTTGTEIDSTYQFDALRAGDDIDVCHVSVSGNGEPKTCYTTSVNDATHVVSDDTTPDTRVTIVAHTDVAWTGGTPPNELDDQNWVGSGVLGTDVHQISIRTNGDITDTEMAGDMLVGSIISTDGDVTLNAPLAILDADGLPTIDVAGRNITMNSAQDNGAGGIGKPDNFLEIDTQYPSEIGNAGGGVLKAYDQTNDGSSNGIFLDELVGDMPLWEAFTTGDAAITTGNASLRTTGGSIRDAKNDGTDNIEAQSVDLDANGGSIGASGNDLNIDSARGPPVTGQTCTSSSAAQFSCGDNADGTANSALSASGDDVSLEATNDIYLTEDAHYLRLALAHAVNGNIRLTVREAAAAHDSNLYLVVNGTARFAESNARSAGDAPRNIPKGQIFAEKGNVLLRIGDDVTFSANSETLAAGSIDIRGDANFENNGAEGADLDPGQGTNMILRGRIIANCVVTSTYPSSGYPVGTCAPSTTNPDSSKLTQVWGNNDIDTFQFGDRSGVTGGEIAGDGLSTFASDGYIFLGSKTIVRGSNSAVTVGDAGHDPSIADGEDRFTVWYLQSMDVRTAPATPDDPTVAVTSGAGHVLNLDGQADTDYYTIYTTGSHGATRNYVVDVLDTGAPNDGQDELAIYGIDNNAPSFNGYVTGTTTRNATDDIFLLRAAKCIDNQTPLGLTAGIPSACVTPTEIADRPAYVALLTGNNDADGGLGLYRDRIQGNEPSSSVQRINYDTALNGRVSVYGLGGNDAFFVDDTSAIATLDGGAGYDLFQIGQIFGNKRDGTEGALLPQDTFPVLIPTTRGWLSPGPHAPLVATGGTGNDEFVVYSNQAELRLEGNDDNDLFIVRAFAIAAVCDTNADSIAGCQYSDVSLAADPVTGNFPVDTNADGTCTSAENPGYGGAGWTGFRKDNNGDGTCNDADAHMTGAATSTTPADPTKWEDDTIPLDANGSASPVIGLGFSTARPLDIRAGGGEDEVQYNVNAPVSVDGGTGFDKLVVLGTEFADDFVITAKAIYGAGLNVRYTTIEVVEVDGLEGDDQFFVLSTAYGVAYRVIGGLGSDTINVAGDVTTDIVTRELEGLSGTIDHRVTSANDPLYNGLPVDGLDYNLATPDTGVVVIEETGSGTAVREGGSIAIPTIDSYAVYLASAPSAPVYVTVSAARSPQEEADNASTATNPLPLPNGNADTIWLCLGNGTPGECSTQSDFQRHKVVNGVVVDEAGRAIVLTFDSTHWDSSNKKIVYMYAVDDPRSEGDRVVVIQHSVISADPRFDGALVRNVEVTVYDNDTPGVFVSQVAPGTTTEDGLSLVIEGTNVTQLTDDVLIQLAKAPDIGQTVVVKLSMDADSQQAMSLSSLDGRWTQHAIGGSVGTYYTIAFTRTSALDNSWQTPVRVTITARDDAKREDPQTAVIAYSCDDSATSVCGVYGSSNTTATFMFPNLRSGPLRTPVTVIDNDTAGVVSIESGTGTLVVKCGDLLCSIPGPTDDYTLRLTKRPQAENDPNHLQSPINVQVSVLTDGLVDVKSVNGVAINYGSLSDPTLQTVGGYTPARMFLGNVTFGIDGSGRRTLTRANGSDLGSFIDEGFAKGQFIEIGNAGGHNGQYYVFAVSDTVLTLTSTSAWAAGTVSGVTVSRLTKAGLFEGVVTVEIAGGARRLVRTVGLNDPLASWLADGFLEGQRVLVCDSAASGPTDAAHCGRFKIAIIRGTNATKDNKIEFTSENAFPASWTNGATLTVKVSRLAAVATFTDSNWYVQQQIVLVADLAYSQPITRQGVKLFPVSTHILSKLQGPLAVEGGVTGADRSLQLGLKLPGEKDGPLFAIGPQPPESKQIDILNVFNDGSQQDGSGTMTSTTIKGLGLAKDLDFGPTYSSGNPQTFGEPAIFPGGISFGTVQFVDGQFQTDGGKSTIEVVNLLLGQGNDSFDVQGTLDPDIAVKLIGTIIITPTGTGIDLTRSLPFDWKSQGFLVGQPVHLSGFPGLTWTVAGFGDENAFDTTDNTVMHLTGPVPTAGQLTGVGQVTTMKTVANVTTGGGAFGGTLTRAAGDWTADGFSIGQKVTISGVTGSWTVLAVTNAGKTLLLGNGSTLLSAASATKTVIGVKGTLQTTTADDVPVTAIIPVTIVSNNADVTLSDGGTVTRSTGSWATDGFVIGQWVMIDGIPGIGWRLLDISLDGKTLTLGRGSPLPGATSATKTVFVPGPHGGLTLVHGGGNLPLDTSFDMTVGANSITRNDGLSWAADGYARFYANGLPMHIQVGGATKTRTIAGFSDVSCPYSDPFPGCGVGSVMTFTAGEPALTPSSGVTSVHDVEPRKATATGSMNITVQPAVGATLPTSTLTCSACAFTTVSSTIAAFKVGMQVTVSGLAGSFTISALTATTITLANVALTPTYRIVGDVTTWSPMTLTVTGYDPLLDGGFRMGGDTLTVCRLACGSVVAGPNSPLVLYGDTSQDGVWYGGHPYDTLGYEFGPKPFDPFTKIPDARERG